MRPDCECGHLATSHRQLDGCVAVYKKEDGTTFMPCPCHAYQPKEEPLKKTR